MNKLALAIAALWVMTVLGCASSQPQVLKEIPPPSAPPNVPPVRAEALNISLRDAAAREIQSAAVSKDVRLRANAIEAAQDAFGSGAHDLVARALTDSDPQVRFAAEMAAGTLKFNDLHDVLLRLASDPSLKVQIGARYALHRLGDTSLSHDLEKTARDPNPMVRTDTAFVLGLLDEPSAVKILKQMMNDSESDVRIQVAESLWRLHDSDALEVLVAGAISKFADDQMLCLNALVAPRDARVEGLLKGKLTDPYIEIALIAARGMGELGKDDGYAVAMKGAKSADPRQRSLGALALGAIGRSDGQDMLATLLKDPEPAVRLAAAKAILQLKPSTSPV